MGQYHYVFNLDKRQYLSPRGFGDGLKLLEQVGWTPGGTPDALHLLLACSSGRGGGDYQSDSDLIGSWAGDRIAIIGDYAAPADIPGVDAAQIYAEMEQFTELSAQLRPLMEREFECVYLDDGAGRVALDRIEGCLSSYGIGDRTLEFQTPEGPRAYAVSVVVKAVRKFYKDDAYRRDPLTLGSLGLLKRGRRVVAKPAAPTRTLKLRRKV